MKAGLPGSLLLHVAVFGGFVVLGGPAEPLAEGRVIPVEIVTLAETTNIRAEVRAPKPEPLPEDQPMTLETPMVRAAEKALEIKITSDDAPTPPTPEPDPEPAEPEDAEPEKVAEVEPVEPVEPEKPSFSLDRIAGLVDKAEDTAPEINQQVALQGEIDRWNKGTVDRAGVGLGTSMTASELDALQSAMYKCWRMPADAQDPEKLVVRLSVKMSLSGAVEEVRVIDRSQQRKLSPGNPFWDVAEQRAVRAVAQCAPYDFLPREKYASWRFMNLNFRPQL